jgi:hypothetical protein
MNTSGNNKLFKKEKLSFDHPNLQNTETFKNYPNILKYYETLSSEKKGRQKFLKP